MSHNRDSTTAQMNQPQPSREMSPVQTREAGGYPTRENMPTATISAGKDHVPCAGNEDWSKANRYGSEPFDSASERHVSDGVGPEEHNVKCSHRLCQDELQILKQRLSELEYIVHNSNGHRPIGRAEAQSTGHDASAYQSGYPPVSPSYVRNNAFVTTQQSAESTPYAPGLTDWRPIGAQGPQTNQQAQVHGESQEKPGHQLAQADYLTQQAQAHAEIRLQSGDRVWRENELRPLMFVSGFDRVSPRLNHAVWSAFKRTQDDERAISSAENGLGDQKETFAIDVLVGEPAIDITASRLSPSRNADFPTAFNPDSLQNSQANLEPASSQMPERIRINSWHIVRVLEEIHRKSISVGPLVLTRPFKILVYYEDKIRDWYRVLETRLQSSDGMGQYNSTKPEEAQPNVASGPIMTTAGSAATDRREWYALSPDAKKDKLLYSVTTLDHMRCLLGFMDSEITPRIHHVRHGDCHGIYFCDLWHLFKPGDDVVSRDDTQQVYRVINVYSDGHQLVTDRFAHSRSDNTPCKLSCVCIDFDGKQLGPVLKTFRIDRFDGEKSIVSLPVYPFRGDRSLRQQHIERGKSFLKLTHIKHMHYDGLTLSHREEVDGQVVIDFEEAFSAQETRDLRPPVLNLIGVSFQPRRAFSECELDCCTAENTHDDEYADMKRNVDFIRRITPETRSLMPSLVLYPRSHEEIGSATQPITDDELLIMSHRVFGFILRTRKWRALEIAQLTPIDSGPDAGSRNREGDEDGGNCAFDQLVLPTGYKDVLKSLVAQHFRDKSVAASDKDDSHVVRGKSQGVIILLHGAPGVGKKSTAECMAEIFRRPLFPIACGDLEMFPQDVEHTLRTIFALASRWGCILLLEEADVFLTARTPTGTMRTGLAFLRVLEQYNGILFLTTNRSPVFELAFVSRVHLSLYYPPLDLNSTIAVLDLNIMRVKQRFRDRNRSLTVEEGPIIAFMTEYWQRYPKARLNGRQIRNACRTALALAEFEAQGSSYEAVVDPCVTLEIKYFKTVAYMYLTFTNYVRDVYSGKADDWEEEKLHRAGASDAKLPSTDPLVMRSREFRFAQNLGGHGDLRDRGDQQHYGQAFGAAQEFNMHYVRPSYAAQFPQSPYSRAEPFSSSRPSSPQAPQGMQFWGPMGPSGAFMGEHSVPVEAPPVGNMEGSFNSGNQTTQPSPMGVAGPLGSEG